MSLNPNTIKWNQCISGENKSGINHKWIDIVSFHKWLIRFIFSLLTLDDFGFLYCFRSGCYLHFRFLNTSNFFVSELNYQVLVCIFLVKMWGIFWYQDYFDLPKLFVFVSPVFHMLRTERRRHDVHVLFVDVSYDVRSAHWHVNNKIKRKFTLFEWIS